jgi:hypothetical protein
MSTAFLAAIMPAVLVERGGRTLERVNLVAQ